MSVAVNQAHSCLVRVRVAVHAHSFNNKSDFTKYIYIIIVSENTLQS